MLDRVKQIKEGMFDEFSNRKKFWGENVTILTDDEVCAKPLVIRRALASKYMLLNMPMDIRPYELIVGMANFGTVELGRTFPHYALENEVVEAAKFGYSEFSTFGHHPINQEKLLSTGLLGYRREIGNYLDKELSKSAPDSKKIEYYHAMTICIDALLDFAKRYSEHAFTLATSEQNPTRRKELLFISNLLTRVPAYPATSFYEALQSTWLIHAALHSCLEYIPIGRADQFLYPYYKKDIEEGVITEDDATVLIACWLAKFSDRTTLYHEDLASFEPHHEAGNISMGLQPLPFMPKNEQDGNFTNGVLLGLSTRDKKYVGASSNNIHQNMILSGQDKDGNEVTNELTYLILKTWGELELINPVMSVRFAPNAPEELYSTCSRILRSGSGEPAIYNDENIINGFLSLGIPLEQARCYSNDGCWETLIPGKSDYSLVTVEIAQCLEFALHQGYSLTRGTLEGLETGNPENADTFDKFYDLFLQQMYHLLDWLMDAKERNYGQVEMIAPDPLISIFMDGCIEKGKDFYAGGAEYVFHGLIAAGFSSCVDSLAAIRKAVYDDRAITMKELVESTRTDFANNEPLRQRLLNRIPKFGNDDEYVDSISRRVMKDYADHVLSRSRIDGIIFVPAIGTFERAGDFGFVLGASPDGRKATEPVGSNYSPVAGRDMHGPTSAIKSVTKADLLPYFNGCPLDLQVNSNEVIGEEGIKRLNALIRSFLDLGGNILTITGVSEEVLRDAQLHPEKHKGLRVRLGGFSGYFVQLSPDYQQIVIDRVKHSV